MQLFTSSDLEKLTEMIDLSNPSLYLQLCCHLFVFVSTETNISKILSIIHLNFSPLNVYFKTKKTRYKEISLIIDLISNFMSLINMEKCY